MKRTKRECWIGEDGYCHVPLANGKGEAICDAEFIEEVNRYSWSINSNGYAQSNSNKKRISSHRFVFILKYKSIKNGLEIDHINKNRLDNRLCNLRLATRSQNQMNKNKTSGNFKGVCFENRVNKYRASIKFNKKQRHIGYFPTEREAAYFYDIWAFHFHKEFCVLNFPDNIEEYKNSDPMNFINRKSPTSSFLGVHFDKKASLFRVRLKINGKSKHIGYFDDEISAAKARDLYIIKNNLNKKLNFSKETYQQELNQESKQMVLFKAS